MMKTNKIAVIVLMFLFMIPVMAQKKEKIKGNKDVVEVFNNLEAFNEIIISDGLGISLMQTSSNSVALKTDSNLVDFEMDIYWLIVAGENPIKWFDKHPNRFKYCHLKDYLKLANDEFESCNLGTGSIDFQTIISHGKKRGLETLVVEQEAYRNSSPMQAAKDNLGFMLNLKG